MRIWKIIENLLQPNEIEHQVAQNLYDDFKNCKSLERTQSSLLELNNQTIAAFYSILTDNTTITPILKTQKNSNWMLSSDFCFVNIRATGLNEITGNFISASKILPAITSSAIHLAPFHPYQFGVIYAIVDPYDVAQDILDPFLSENGIGATAQLFAFVEACHLLGKTVGYDLVPHVAQYAKIVLDFPEAFAWIQIAPDKKKVLENHHPYGKRSRNKALHKAKKIIFMVKKNSGISLFSQKNTNLKIKFRKTKVKTNNTDKKNQIKSYNEAINNLITEGLWPIPSQVWNGIGLPEFHYYNIKENYPVFSYLDKYGIDASSQSYGIVTPFSFFDKIPPNQKPDPQNNPKPNKHAINLYSDIFPYWRDLIGFDFIRFDSVDHIFDSVLDKSGFLPISDRPTPLILSRIIKTARSKNNYRIGTLAERMGTEFEEYSKIGFDLVLGNDMLKNNDYYHFKEIFDIYDHLEFFNNNLIKKTEKMTAVSFALDTHDTGNPHLLGTSMIQTCALEKLTLRHFTARFISVGTAKRPMYEVMGYQDMSWGLYEANITPKNLFWTNNEKAAKSYSYLEHAYSKLKPFLENARIIERKVTEKYVWWIISNKNCQRIIICSIFFDTSIKCFIKIPIKEITGKKQFKGFIYDFHNFTTKKFNFSGDILIENSPYPELLLYDLLHY